eukprot:TRINITY_DN14357_c0_g1_i1.p1 TRINITY_DN14357_c0_g1~~TRINITY_DN14357_c0_g1_i1.p1  ORF type:complete len:337 (+),score=95.75 TRINITY_DN14357_c0_g1_i1:65-1012(+)
MQRPLAAARRWAAQQRAHSTKPAPTRDFCNLEGRVAVVCGAGNPPTEDWGIGMATAIVMARRGARVVAVSRCTTAQTSEHCAAVIHGESNECLPLQADMSTHAGVESLLDRVLEAYGKVDILVNAGVHNAQPNGLEKFTEETWLNSIQTNLHAQYHLCRHFAPAMVRTGGGCILHYTTMAGTTGLGLGKQRHGYVAGKAGAAELTKRVGIEYASQGLRAVVVSIGYIKAPLVKRAVVAASARQPGPMDKDLGRALLEKNLTSVHDTRDSYVPRGKQGTPMEVANVGAFLASDEASFINATEVFVDGGSTTCTYGP